MVSLKEAARRIREHNRIHHLAEPLNSPIITEILETAATTFEQIDAGMYKPIVYAHWIYCDNGAAKCSNCKQTFKDVYDQDNVDAFCRKCGAKMNV